MMCLYCPPALRDILLTSMARYSLFVLKLPINTKQTNKQVKVCYINSVSTFSQYKIQK